MSSRLKLKWGITSVLFLFVLASCSDSAKLAGNGNFSKRKYTDGSFFQLRKVKTSSSEEGIAAKEEKKSESTTVALETAQAEQYEVVAMKKSETKEVITETSEEPALNSASNKVTRKIIQSNRVEETAAITNNESSDKSSVQVLKNESKKVKKMARKKQISDTALLYYILAFLIPFLAVGLVTDWDITKVLICVLLCIIIWLPGVIYALIVVSNNV